MTLSIRTPLGWVGRWTVTSELLGTVPFAHAYCWQEDERAVVEAIAAKFEGAEVVETPRVRFSK